MNPVPLDIGFFYKLPDPPNFEVVDSSLYCIPSTATKSVSDTDDAENVPFESKAEFFKFIDESVIGVHKPFHGAFGDRKVVYCDYIASGRSLFFLENFIYNEVLPHYGNTHTTTSITSLQTTLFRHEAKDIVRNAVRASDYDAVFFVGSGCTGAVHKLIHNLHMTKPPIVIVGPFEHHSNMLPWRHMAAKITRLKTDITGNVSLDHLKQVLEEESKLAQEQDCDLIVCLAAASNVTGILLDVNVFSALVHRHGGLIFWDYATAAPYVDIDMNPVITGPDRDYVYKDAIYFSMHKFVGGVQTPGVLVAKRVLFKAGETHPDGCGGGSVCFVRREAQVYLQDVEEREEGGTPAIVESIRAGLVMQLKQAVTSEAITAREEVMVKRAWSRLKGVENLLILGGDRAPRLPIFSIVVRHAYPLVNGSGATPSNEAPQLSPEAAAPTQPGKSCLFLHHAFVAALLNDLFGVQCRAGCACAGPYAMDLLGIDEALAKLYEGALVKSGVGTCRISRFFDASAREVLRPGFTRFSIPFFMSDEEADFVFDAVRFVATYGWAFLPLYTYEATTGEWHHRNYDAGEDRQWLGHIQYSKQGMVWRRGKAKSRGPLPKSYKECLMTANAELKKAIEFVKSAPVSPVPDDTASFDEDSQKLRWFLLPCEAAAQMRGEVGQLAVPTGPRSPWHPDAAPLRASDVDKEGEKATVKTLDPGNGQPTYKSNASPSESPMLKLPAESTKVYSGGLSVDDGFSSLNPQTLTQMSQVDSSTCLRTKTVSTLSAVNEPVPEQRNNHCVLARQDFHVAADSHNFMEPEEEKQVEMLDDDELQEVISNLNGLYMPPKPSKTQSLIRSLKLDHSLWKRPIKQLYKPFLTAIKKI
uniref:tRNA 2-thiocytidine biosynthesis protein TtcA n=2 Tax=Schistocephalus solidus TaxID=70667 RepID=A0A0V0J287_SCHSO